MLLFIKAPVWLERYSSYIPVPNNAATVDKVDLNGTKIL